MILVQAVRARHFIGLEAGDELGHSNIANRRNR
jgi:hypothetical protein